MKKLFLLICAVAGFVFIIIWQLFFTDTNYYLVAVVILILSMLPFFVSFEKSRPSARELTLIAGLIAVAVISRAVFYLIPQVKPIGAVVIVCGACLGAKRGYFIGAMSAFLSNFIFGQGIWTPFQMVAMGIVGLAAGLMFNKKAKRIPMAIAGFVLCFAVYGLIVDLSSVLMMTNDYSMMSVLSIYAAGVPFGLTFGASTAVFLLLFGEAFAKKINRIVIKYGILEGKNE
ncbi:MAG: ECF transporter S component [Eubacterium sp.]|nr:ECF transporter S component [Eubacterium sp.]